MQIIRLSRTGHKHMPMYRLVLTDHKKPVKSGYTNILGWYNPIRHEWEFDIEQIKKLLTFWTKMSERAARLCYNDSKDEVFKKYITVKDIERKKKKED